MHEILNVNNEEKARSALQMASEKWDGRLGVTTNFDPSVDHDFLGYIIIGHTEYAIYRIQS